MSRITKEIANRVAVNLTSKKLEEYELLRKNYSSKAFDIYMATIPKEVVELKEKFPEYFSTAGYLNITGNGFNYDQIKLEKRAISKGNGGSYYSPSPQDAKILMAMKNKVEDAKKSCQDLVREIENLVYHLRTYAKVSEQFPEAIPFLPNKPITTALAINIDDIRKKL
jgi:hypothetical protein